MKRSFLHLAFTLLGVLCMIGCQNSNEPANRTRVIQTAVGFELLRNGRPFVVRGAAGTTDLELLVKTGGNTIRTWDAEGIEPLLNRADELGLAVVVGIWLEHQRHGYDHSDPAQRLQQQQRVERFVKQFRNHPAVLAWGVGNEVEVEGDFNIALEQIRDASRIIKSLDPDHPTVAIIAELGEDKAKRIHEQCPDIDIIGVNAYGGMGSVADRLLEQGYTGPFLITEYGPVGPWETGKTPWGAPYEQTSTQKAEFIEKNYRSTILPNLGKRCLGSFAFLWGHKQETTATWFGLLLPTGETTESVDRLHELWTGSQPENLAPKLISFEIDADPAKLFPGQVITARVGAQDPENDELSVEWHIFPESTVKSIGGDFEPGIEPEEVAVRPIDTMKAELTLPDRPGAYRVFVTVRDDHNHAATANIPILVSGPTDTGSGTPGSED